MLFTLIIRERNHSWAGRGPVTSMHETREAAEAALRDYVHRNWDAEMGTAPPGDLSDMISEYFDEVLEQYDNNMLIRPLLQYTGPMDKQYTPIEQR